MELSDLRKRPTELKCCRSLDYRWTKINQTASLPEMWAFVVLTFAFAVAVGASEPADKQTAAEEKLVIARGKLLVSLGGAT